MNSRLDDVNFANDARVRNIGLDQAPLLYVFDDDGLEIEIELPTKWTVCPTCNGAGKHVNAAIDCGGISASEFHDDPDFADAYMSGTYDVTCETCKGRTTVPGVDLDAMTDDLREQWLEQERQHAESVAENLAEIRAGA